MDSSPPSAERRFVFNFDEKTADAIANLAGIGVMTITYKEVGREGGEG